MEPSLEVGMLNNAIALNVTLLSSDLLISGAQVRLQSVLKSHLQNLCEGLYFFMVEDIIMSLNSGSKEAPPTKNPSILGHVMRPIAVVPLTDPP